MTKGGKLIWELFLWLREVMPPTADNTRRQTEWAARFHEMEAAPGGAAPPPEPPDDDAMAQLAEEPEPAGDEVAADPHEHGVPDKPKPARKKR